MMGGAEAKKGFNDIPLEFYIVGSLRNIPRIRLFAFRLRCELEAHKYKNTIVNDSWTSHGCNVDKQYYKYIQSVGWTYTEAIQHEVVTSIFELDESFIERADVVIMLEPCGKSAALELGYAAGIGKKTYIIKDEIKGIEVMERFATQVYENKESFFDNLAFILFNIHSTKLLKQESLEDETLSMSTIKSDSDSDSESESDVRV
jgi:hypothetical protein